MKENKGTMESVTLGRVPDSERKKLVDSCSYPGRYYD